MRDKRLKRADENKHQDYLEEDFDEEYHLFNDAKKIAQTKREKDLADKKAAEQELFLMKNALLIELNKIDQKTSSRGKLNLISSKKESCESITLYAEDDYKIVSFNYNIHRDCTDSCIKPCVWADLYEFGIDEYIDRTHCAFSVKDMPKLFKEVAHPLSKWI